MYDLYERAPNGVSCTTCGQRCCISCETQNKSCPFSRQELMPWIKRIGQITLNQFYKYLQEYTIKNIIELEKFNQAKRLFIDIVRDIPYAYEYFDQLEDDDILYNMMLVARDYIYGTALSSKNIDDIDFLLEFIEDIHDRLENPEVCLDLDMDQVEELLFEPMVSHKIKKKRMHPPSCFSTPKIHTGMFRWRHHYHILTD